MKDHIVKALINFDDYEGQEVKFENPHIARKINNTFNCTKERYEYLKKNNAVELVGIEKKTEEIVPEVKIEKPIEVKTKTTKKPTTRRKK